MSTSSQPSLHRTLGLFTSTLLVTSLMIGSGVFKKIVPMAQTGLSEGWILMAWTVAGVATLLSAFNLAALACLTEESGGIYEYLRLCFGNFFSFLFGWTTFSIIGTAINAALAFILAQTINTLVDLPDPLDSWKDVSIADFIFPFADSGIKIVAILFLSILTWINYRGVRKAGNLSNVFTMAKVIGILILIVMGLLYSAPASPTETANLQPPGNNNLFISAFFTAMLSALWAYNGWQDLSNITGEVKNPKRNVALAIIFATLIAMSLYLLVNSAYMNVLSLGQLAAVQQNQIGGAVVAKTLIGNVGQTIIIILIMVSVFSSLNSAVLTIPRIYFRMAQENYFFKKASLVHPRFRTPYMALLYSLIWSCVLVLTGTFDILTNMVIFVVFLFNGLLAVAVVKMRRNGSIKARPVGYPVVQAIVLLFSLALVVNTFVTEPKQSLIGVGLVLTSVPFYYYFRSRQKKQAVVSET